MDTVVKQYYKHAKLINNRRVSFNADSFLLHSKTYHYYAFTLIPNPVNITF